MTKEASQTVEKSVDNCKEINDLALLQLQLDDMKEHSNYWRDRYLKLKYTISESLEKL